MFDLSRILAGPIAAQGNGGLPAGVLACADGSFMLAVGTDEQYRRFCEIIGREDLAADPRFTTIRLRAENRHALRTSLQEALRGISAAQLLPELDAVDVATTTSCAGCSGSMPARWTASPVPA